MFGHQQGGNSSAFGAPPSYESLQGAGAFGASATSSVWLGGTASPFGQTGHLSTEKSHAVSPFNQNQQPTFGFGQKVLPVQASLPGYVAAMQSNVAFSQSSAAGTSIFGQTPSPSAPAFGQSPVTCTSFFGQTPSASSIPTFGQTPLFGQPPSTSAPIFGQTPSTSAPIFGQTPSTSTPIFGHTPTSAPIFGQTPSTSAPIFGQTPSTSTPIFGQTPSTSAPVFGHTPSTPASIFAQTPSLTTSIFGDVPSTTTSIFGHIHSTSVPIHGQSSWTSGSSFGQTPSTSSSVFGHDRSSSTSSSSTFRQHSSSASIIGQPPVQSTTLSVFGKPTSSVFGVSEATAVKPNIFGQTTTGSGFAQSTIKPASLFGQLQTTTSASVKTTQLSTGVPSVFGMSKPTTLFGHPQMPSGHSSTTVSTTTASNTGEREYAGVTKKHPLFAGASSYGAKRKLPSDSTVMASAQNVDSKRMTSEHRESEVPPSGFKRASVLSPSRSVFGGAPVTSSASGSFGTVKPAGSSSVFGGKVASQEGNLFPKVGEESQSAFQISSKPSITKASFKIPASASVSTTLLAENEKSKASQSSVFGASAKAEEPSILANLLAAPKPSEIPPLFQKHPRRGQLEPTAAASLSRALRRSSDSSKEKIKLVSPDDVSETTTLVCKSVPHLYNNKPYLLKHFRQFGMVKRVLPQPQNRSALIYFADHESAERAKLNGTILKPGTQPISIFWRAKSKTEKKGKERMKESNKTDSPSVCFFTIFRRRNGSRRGSGLRSMSGSSDFEHDTVSLRTRPAESRSESQLTFKRSPTRHSTRKSRSSTPEVKSSSRGSRGRSFKSMLKTIAVTANDKYLLLEERDKLIREAHQKSADFHSKAVIGTCPDMCPEKERYVREHRKQLSMYELLPETEFDQNPRVDHSTAIKEYQRSAADQEEPLPHELRPPEVLAMTMDYLVNNIMDLGKDGEWADWYDFIWNRTRGIRKDITQQDISNPTCVTLVEKCARFHIHCAERLCEEDMMTFDPKINDENLTNCLQTLKQMYHDLARDQKWYSMNESEFMSYDVLLNLNEGDTLRKVQNYRTDVRNSPVVKFALNVETALNSNNFVRFFKLVREAPYLHACLMHRYFNQVRVLALRTIVRACCPSSGHLVQYPLNDLVHSLSFRDADEAREFVEHYGVRILKEVVTLEKNALVQPERPFVVGRTPIIENKRTVSVGEVVNGSPILPFTKHIPKLSFDPSGHYIGLLPEAASSSLSLKATESSTSLKDFDSTQAGTLTSASLAVIKDVARELFRSVIAEIAEEQCEEIIDECSSDEKLLSITIDGTANNILQELIVNEVKSACILMYSAEEQHHLQEKKRVEAIEQKALVCNELKEEIVFSVVQHDVTRLAQTTVSEAQALRKETMIHRSALELVQDVVKLVTRSLIDQICSEVCENVLKEKEYVEMCEHKIRIAILSRYFGRWKRSYFVKQLHRRRSMLAFPSTNPLLSATEQSNKLYPEGADRPKLTRQNPVDVVSRNNDMAQSLILHNYINDIKQQLAWHPINIANLVKPYSGKDAYWKFVLFLHECKDGDEVSDMFSAWLVEKLSKGGITRHTCRDVEVLSLYSLEEQKPLRCRISVCVTHVKSAEFSSRAAKEVNLKGVSGILFALFPPGGSDIHAYLKSAVQKLNVLFDRSSCQPAAPVTFLLMGWATATMLANVTDFLWSTVKTYGSENIADFNVIGIPDDLELQEATLQLQNSISWLAASQAPDVPNLCATPLVHFVEEGLSKCFYQLVYEDAAKRHCHGFTGQQPRVLTNLYHAALQHLSNICTDSMLTSFSWPIYEFSERTGSEIETDHLPVDWNTPDRLAYVGDIFLSLKLPVDDLDSCKCANWDDACDTVWAFANSVTSSSSDESATLLNSRLKKLLQKAEATFRETCALVTSMDECTPSPSNMPWLYIIDACITHKLQHLYSLQASDKNLIVCSLPGKINEFRPPSEWSEAAGREYLPHTSFNDTVLEAVDRKKNDSHVFPMYTAAEVESDVQLFKDDIVPFEVGKAKEKLLSLTFTAKRESEAYERTLSELVHADVPPLSSFTAEDFTSVLLTLNGDVKTMKDSLFTEEKPALLSNGDSQMTQTRFPPLNADQLRKEKAHASFLSNGIEESLSELNRSLESSKLEDVVFEMRLKHLVEG